MRFRTPIFYLVLFFVTTNFVLILLTYKSRGVIPNESRDYTTRPKQAISTNKLGTIAIQPRDVLSNKSNRYTKVDKHGHQLRQDLERLIENFPNISSSFQDTRGVTNIIRKEKLIYPTFNITEPKFINSDWKLLFYKQKDNREKIGIPTKDQLLGEIITIRRGTFSMPHDCGYQSKVSHVLKARAVLQGRWFRSLVPMIVPDGGTFQHFLDGTLPKIIQALEYIQRPQVKLLMPRIRDSIIYEILEKLNISREKIVSYSGSVGADYLVYTCVTPPLHPLLWQKARSLIGVPEKRLTPKTKAKIVIITRKGCFNCGRLLLNKKELKSSLERKYPESSVVEFQGPLNLSASISLFGSTGVIIGVHGGGLYNINFCPSNTTVIEIMPTLPDGTVRYGPHQIFWTQSILLGHDYWRIPTKPVNGNEDVKVNITQVENIIDRTRKT